MNDAATSYPGVHLGKRNVEALLVAQVEAGPAAFAALVAGGALAVGNGLNSALAVVISCPIIIIINRAVGFRA